jgi:hypothetical protein
LIYALFPVYSLVTSAQDNIPELNQEIIEYVNTVIGKKVDRGECWDLAYQALTRNDAQWDGEYVYGKRVNPLKDQIFPGDIIQFKGVKLQYQKGNTVYKETMPHHTAIVYKVIRKGVFELAHQNTGFSGKKVGISQLNIRDVVKGKMQFYRPIH